MRKWIELEIQPLPEGWETEINLPDLVTRILLRRGYSDIRRARGFLDPHYYQPTSPFDLPGMDKAVELLVRAYQKQEKVCIWGDYDVDGQTSTALLLLALRRLGIKTCFYVPVRAIESHGINRSRLERLIHGDWQNHPEPDKDDQPIKILLTCDTGISAIPEIDYVRSKGIKVIVTDHHELPPVLPKANAIINPQLLSKGNPLSTLPGVGVAYKLVEALFQRCDINKQIAHELLDLVALGIVADLAVQTDDTRFLLQAGLQVLRQTKRAGLLEIARQAEIDLKNVNEELIGYEIAPRLNSIGRLGDANKAVRLLTTEDEGEARQLALEIEGMNNHRKLITNQVYQAAVSHVERNPDLLKQPALILFHPDWPAGILGICASRLVERYHLPTILIQSNHSGTGRGSARSIEGLNITEVLEENSHFLLGYGGHAMAAGFSIDPSKIDDFRNSIIQSVQKTSITQLPELHIDAEITLPDLCLELAEELECLSPFGPGNPPVVLACRDLQIIQEMIVGRQAEHRLVTVSDENHHKQKIIWWQGAGYPLPETNFDLAVSVRSTDYQGVRQLQVEWIDYRLTTRGEIQLREALRQVEYFDFRKEENPIQKLEEFIHNKEALIWAEGDTTHWLIEHSLAFNSRLNLHPAEALIIWTVPGHPGVLRVALESVNPKYIALFGFSPTTDQLQNFIRQLTGMVKYLIAHQNGFVEIDRLAAGMAQPKEAVKCGLDWLEAKGSIQLKIIDGVYQVSMGGDADAGKENQIIQKLDKILAEVRSYRSYYLRAEIEAIFGG